MKKNNNKTPKNFNQTPVKSPMTKAIGNKIETPRDTEKVLQRSQNKQNNIGMRNHSRS